VSKIIRRRKYDKEFKEQAVRRLLEGEKTTQQLAEELGIHWGMLGRWKREHLERLDGADPEKPASKLEEENQRLRKELASVQEPRDIFKKALSIFSRTNNTRSDL